MVTVRQRIAWDRIGGGRKQRWVKTVPTTGSYVPPVFVDNEVAYSSTSDVTAVLDNAIKDGSGTPRHLFDRLATYDNLRRLKQQTEGATSGLGGSISTQARVELFARNLAGKITSDKVSLDSNSTYTDGPLDSLTFGEMDDTRTYNKRGELRQRVVKDVANPGGVTYNLAYDLNGNMTSDGEKYDYVYNPWCQVVSVTTPGGAKVVANFTYNGLGQKISEQTDVDVSGDVDGSDPVFYILNDLQGRRVATFRDVDDNPMETFVYNSGSVRGPGIAGGVILRERAQALFDDPDAYWNADGEETRDERIYYCSDFRGDVAAMTTAAGKLYAQMRYSAYGVPFGIPLGDMDSDGVVEDAGGMTPGDDRTIWDGGKTTYDVRADLNLDGTIDTDDESIMTANGSVAVGRGVMTTAGVGNRFGWRGSVGMAWYPTFGRYGMWATLYVADLGMAIKSTDAICAAPPEVSALPWPTEIFEAVVLVGQGVFSVLEGYRTNCAAAAMEIAIAMRAAGLTNEEIQAWYNYAFGGGWDTWLTTATTCDHFNSCPGLIPVIRNLKRLCALPGAGNIGGVLTKKIECGPVAPYTYAVGRYKITISYQCVDGELVWQGRIYDPYDFDSFWLKLSKSPRTISGETMTTLVAMMERLRGCRSTWTRYHIRGIASSEDCALRGVE